MEINNLIKIQKEFDTLHNWTPTRGDTQSILSSINKDIIGILGELGEFANIIKKLNLVADKNSGLGIEKKYSEYKEELSDEVVDTFIYLMRIISHLDIDITEEYFKKLEINRKKYKDYEKNE